MIPTTLFRAADIYRMSRSPRLFSPDKSGISFLAVVLAVALLIAFFLVLTYLRMRL